MSSSGATAGVAVGIIDSLTNTAVGISDAHYHVHDGLAFLADIEDTTMGDSDVLSLVFKTAAGTKRVHLLAEYTTLVGGNLELWEGATWTAQSGTSVAILNRKRETSMTSSNILADQAQAGFVAADVMHANPTGLAVGGATRLHHFITRGKKDKLLAGGARDVAEIILKPGTQYAVRFTAVGGSNAGQITLNWYEHTDA